MRIRTVKPEFWGHPVLAKLSDESRLLAIGLLNMADDEGYFLADPLLIRSAFWPFDDQSSKARRSIDDLSRIGYISISKHETHGYIGFVINFKKHQKVDRPNASKLATYYDSTNVRRSFDDQSTINRRRIREQGTGIREQGTGSRDQISGNRYQGGEGGGDIQTLTASAVSIFKNDKIDEAETIYNAYPRKVGKLVALKAIKKAMATLVFAELLNATTAYRNATNCWSKEKQSFIPNPATWFNQGRYLDDPKTWQATGKDFVEPLTPEEYARSQAF